MRKLARTQICYSEMSSGGGKKAPAKRGVFQRIGDFGRRLIGR